MPMAALTSFLAMVGCVLDLCCSVPGALQALYAVHPCNRGFADGIMSRLLVNAAQQKVHHLPALPHAPSASPPACTICQPSRMHHLPAQHLRGGAPPTTHAPAALSWQSFMDPGFMGGFNQIMAQAYAIKLNFGWPQIGGEPDAQHAELAAYLGSAPLVCATIRRGGQLFDFW